MNQDVSGNKKLFWKKVGKLNGEKVENCSRTKDENGMLGAGENEVQRTWKDYY